MAIFNKNNKKGKQPEQKGRIRRTGGFVYRNFFNVGSWLGFNNVKEGGSFIIESFYRTVNSFLGEKAANEANLIAPKYSNEELTKMRQGFLVNTIVLAVCTTLSLGILVYFLINAHWFAFFLWILITVILGAYSYKLFLALNEVKELLNNNKRGKNVK